MSDTGAYGADPYGAPSEEASSGGGGSYGSGVYGEGVYGEGGAAPPPELTQVVEETIALPIAVLVRVPIPQLIDSTVLLPVEAYKEPNPFGAPTELVGVEGTIAFDMSDGTVEDGEPNPNDATKTYWYTWIAPDSQDGLLQRFHTRGSNVDTALTVYTGDTFETLTEVAVSNDGSGDDGDLRWVAIGGQQYRIQVGALTDPATDVHLTWLSGEPQPYDSFAAPIVLDGEYGADELTNTNNTLEVGEPVPSGAVATAWMEWTSPATGQVSVTARSTDPAEFTLQALSGSTLGSLAELGVAVGTGTQSLLFEAVEGTTYRFRIASADDYDSGYEVYWNVVAVPVPPEEIPYPHELPTPGEPLLKVGLNVWVYEADGVTPITEVPRRTGVSGQESLNVAGSGAISIPYDDPILDQYPDLFAYGHVVKFFLGSKCISGFKIRRRRTKLVTSSEYSGMVREVFGPTVHYMLEDFIVRHDGDPRPDSLDVRYYSWASKPGEWYNDGDWDATVNEWSMDDPPSNRKKNKPKNWKVRTAKWINMTHAGGWRYFRRNWTNNVNGRLVRIFATADEWWKLYLDGEEIMSGERREVGYTEFERYDTVLSKGQHTFAALARGMQSSKGDGNDSFLFAMCEVDLDGKIIRPPLLVSNNAWKGHKGNPPPGWNRAQVLRNVVKEAKLRNIQNALRLEIDFTGTHDSAGKRWPDVSFNQEVRIGTTGLDLQAQLSEGNGFDVWVNPANMKLQAWKRRGSDKSASVTLEPGRNLLDWEVNETDEVINTWLIQYDGGWTEYKAQGSREDYGKREGYVSLSNVKDDRGAEKLMQRAAEGLARAQNRAGTGEIHRRPHGQPEGGLIGVEGAYPFLDFNVGDTVKGPNAAGKLVPVRVLSLSFTEDVDGRLTFAPEVEEIRSV